MTQNSIGNSPPGVESVNLRYPYHTETPQIVSDVVVLIVHTSFFYSQFPFPIPHSQLPIPHSQLPTPNSPLPTPPRYNKYLEHQASTVEI
ncbi:MAG: hypothetical protein KME64_25050 [Scytonematopsis contorta HA4267-MV1]|nr:hypothetical protein [Scytonematopsis contorta HA4267-MV1]